MSTIWKGSAAAQLVRTEFGFDPATGPYRELEYTGPSVAIESITSGARAQGAVVREMQDGPVKTCTIRYADWGTGNELPYEEVWTHTTEIVEKEIWAAPWVQEWIFHAACPSSSQFKKAIEDGIDGGKSEDEIVAALQEISAAWVTFLATNGGEPGTIIGQIYREIMRGADHYVTEANVIRRVRTASLSYLFDTVVLATKWIYPPSKLVLPSGMWVYNVDSYPPTEPEAATGWRVRAQEWETSTDRRTETLELVLAAWSTNLYTEWTGGTIDLTA